jgi:hypothetical protein
MHGATIKIILPTFGFPANSQTVQNVTQYFDAAARKLNIENIALIILKMQPPLYVIKYNQYFSSVNITYIFQEQGHVFRL